MNITASEILSPVESRKDPLFDTCLVILATLPSTISRKPPKSIRQLPMSGRYTQYSPTSDRHAYRIPASVKVIRLNQVKKFADKPVHAKIVPTFVKNGASVSLILLSKFRTK